MGIIRGMRNKELKVGYRMDNGKVWELLSKLFENLVNFYLDISRIFDLFQVSVH